MRFGPRTPGGVRGYGKICLLTEALTQFGQQKNAHLLTALPIKHIALVKVFLTRVQTPLFMYNLYLCNGSVKNAEVIEN